MLLGAGGGLLAGGLIGDAMADDGGGGGGGGGWGDDDGESHGLLASGLCFAISGVPSIRAQGLGNSSAICNPASSVSCTEGASGNDMHHPTACWKLQKRWVHSTKIK